MPERSNVTLRRVRKQKRVDLTRGHGQQRAGTVATPVAERKALRMAGTVARPVAERKALRRSRRAERCTERLARTNDSTEGLKAVGTAAADGHIAHLRQQPQALDIATAARQGVPRKRAAAQVADADAPRAAAHPQGLPSRLDQAVHADGRTYYCNQHTKKTTWKEPTLPAPPVGWKVHPDADHGQYYHNASTDSTQWKHTRTASCRSARQTNARRRAASGADQAQLCYFILINTAAVSSFVRESINSSFPSR